ncbi:drug resistance transporter, EmrB/QacA subfamily [Nonomuraea solani]|uniref:Drug resistance transporter, EmrB/QacA subfamily n=1 Tax=Nonomuraea solani TaxID=1144553 RepID=A0A1H6ENT9_9ACTN|nr:DHA2 family efflux MFS transporter permease subunit [Nonomuraea solani]SEG99540.1 drug resistance transporter, EmrB/QacA subfamily [Nonomuraea solani]
MDRHPRRWLILVVLCLSTAVLVIDNMVLNVAIPPLAEDLGASAQDIQWIMESYMLVFAGLLLTAGGLSDRYGRRRVLIIGLALFGLASLAATFATDPGQLILARAVMGVGGALIMPSTLSILITVFDEDERRKAMAAWSAVAMTGLIGGPVLGGVLIAWFWWGAVFLINVPIAIGAIVAAVVLMPESKGPWSKPDPLGAILSVAGMTALVYTIIELPVHGLGRVSTLVSLVVAVGSLAAFVIWELRTPSPMVPLELFKNRNFSGASVSLTLVQIGNGGLLLVLTQYLQFVLGYTPTEAGLAFLPMAVASLSCNALGAALGARVGNRALAAGGLVVVAGAFGLLATVSAGDGFVVTGAALFLLGAGGGLAVPAAITALMGAVPAERAGVGSALNDTIQQMGAALGVAILGSIVAAGFTGAMPGSAPEQARRSLPDALGVAAGNGDAGLAQVARDAFTGAMSTGFLISAAGVLIAAALAFTVMRRRPAPAAAEEPALVPAGH